MPRPDPIGTRSVLRTSPSEPHAHSIVGAIAFNVGLLAESIGRNTLALALDEPLAWIGRLRDYEAARGERLAAAIPA